MQQKIITPTFLIQQYSLYRLKLRISNNFPHLESAHRTVVQKRMKQSGQRWSMEGAQHMLNLRLTRKNLQWHKIIELTKSEFKTVA